MHKNEKYYTFGKVECAINSHPFGWTKPCNGNWKSHPHTYEMLNKHTLPYYRTENLLNIRR